MRKPIQYAVYKGLKGSNGCLQFELNPCDWSETTDMGYAEAQKKAKGCVMLHARAAIGKNKYDNDNAVVIKLSETDLGAILAKTNKLGQEGDTLVDIIHRYERKDGTVISSRVSISQGNERDGEPTFMWNVGRKVGDDRTNVTVPVSYTEMTIIRELVRAGIVSILGW